MKIMNLWLPEEDLAKIDELVRLNRFSDRSKFVRYAIKKALKEESERAPINV